MERTDELFPSPPLSTYTGSALFLISLVVPCPYFRSAYYACAMESAALEALDLPDSQSQSQPWTQTQTQQTQPSQGQSQGNSSRFPSDLWGILVAVTGHRTASASEAAAAAPPHKAAAAGTNDPSKQNGGALTPPPPAAAPAAALPRPERLELFKGQNSYMVGRHPKSDLRLNGPKISSTHAKIWIDPQTGIIRLENLGTNGTYVRNSKVSERPSAPFFFGIAGEEGIREGILSIRGLAREKIDRVRVRQVSKGNVTILESGDPIVFGPASADFDHEFRYIFQCDPALGGASSPADPYGLGELSQSQSADGKTSIHSFYEVREQIGKGSFAVVRKGVRRSDGMMVAIKIIQRARFAHNAKTVEMIEREVGIIQTLEHVSRRFFISRGRTLPDLVSLLCSDSAFDVTITLRTINGFGEFAGGARAWLPQVSFHRSLTDPLTRLVLEYVDGGDLLEYVMKRRGLSASPAARLSAQMGSSVRLALISSFPRL